MKIKITKNNPSIKLRTSKHGGFALLFAVLVSSLLLTIGLSILNISLKELAISTSSRQSIYAFYAADSGLEYAKYKDLKVGWEPMDSLYYDGSDAWSPEPKTIDISDSGIDLGEPTFRVVISKYKNFGSTRINTTIDSTGYDSQSDDRLERAIVQTY